LRRSGLRAVDLHLLMARTLPRAALLVVLGLAACRSPSQVPDAPLPPAPDGGAPEASVLGKNDVVEVKVFQEQDFSGIYRVSSGGTLDFPYCKNLAVLGLTPEELAAKLTVCLAPRVLKNPQ